MLDEYGWYEVSSRSRLDVARMRSNPFQEIAVRLLVWGGGFSEKDAWGSKEIYSEEYDGKRYVFYGWGRRQRIDATYSLHTRGPRLDLYLDENVKPLIVIDLSLFLEHVHPSELLSLRSQIAASLGIIRRFLWDRHLLLTCVREGVYEWLSVLLGKAKIQYTSLPTSEALEVRGIRRIIVLDPYAEEPLTQKDLVYAEAFVLGGVVDKIARPGSTARIARSIHNAERRKIVLRGMLHGVPNRINSIVEILLKALYVYNGNMEKSIIDTMSKRDIRLRAYIEIARFSGHNRSISWDFFCELRRWLPLTIDDFIRAARMAHVSIVGKPNIVCEEDQQRPTSS